MAAARGRQATINANLTCSGEKATFDGRSWTAAADSVLAWPNPTSRQAMDFALPFRVTRSLPRGLPCHHKLPRRVRGVRGCTSTRRPFYDQVDCSTKCSADHRICGPRLSRPVMKRLNSRAGADCRLLQSAIPKGLVFWDYPDRNHEKRRR